MEREHRRKTSSETRFELNAILSVFSYSRAVFLNTEQQEQVLSGRIPKAVSFSYNQDASNAFDSNASSEVPPVHELFGGLIGPDWYLTPLNTETDCGAQMNEPRSPSQAQEILIPEHQPTLGQETNVNSTASWNDSKETELLSEIIDADEAETVLPEYD